MVKHMQAVLVLTCCLVAPVASGELVLLDFSSPYCGPCQQMKPTIERLRAAGYPIRPVDVTAEPQLASQYHVTQVPCFVLVDDGQEVERMVGGTSGDTLQAMFRRAAGRSQALAQQVSPGVRTQSPDAARTPVQPPTSPWMGVVQQSRNDAAATPAAQPASFNRDLNSQFAAAAAQPPAQPASAAVAATDSPSQLINASVRIRVDDATGRSYGTGTIIDARSGEALVITCGHLFRESKGQGPVVIEMFEMTPSGPRVVGEVAGQVINYNLDRDVALVGIRPGRPVSVAPVASPGATIGRGDRVTSVGCDHGHDPTALATRVTALDRYQGPPNLEAAGAPVEGRSGGGLFDSQGRLVGVCFAADYEGNEGLYTALEAIYDELNAVGLSDIYQPADDAGATTKLAAAGPSGLSPVVRGQDSLQAVAPPPAQRGATPASRSGVIPASFGTPSAPAAGAAQAMPAGLSAAEQAAWEEIMSRAATSEVICIIRPKQPGGQSEVITLDGVSPAFVEALARQQHQGPSTATR